MAKGGKFAFTAILVLVCVATYFAFFSPAPHYFADEEAQFHAFATRFGKTYADEAERTFRFNRFREVAAYVKLHNEQNTAFQLEVNEFADLTEEEFRSKYLSTFSPRPQGKLRASLPVDGLPKAVDWNAAGAVSTPMNQGSCGGCWAFSTAGAVEGLHFLKTKTLYQLSPQQMIDCSSGFGNEGCNGGLMDDAFRYLLEVGGLMTEKDYPFRHYNGRCAADPSKFVAKITGFADVAINNEMQLKAAVAHQPVAVGIQANQGNFMYYHSGVIDHGCGSDLDHAVLVVGYGEEGGLPYWLVKNSWGNYWGEKGFVKILRQDSNDRTSGMCGIASMPSYPF